MADEGVLLVGMEGEPADLGFEQAPLRLRCGPADGGVGRAVVDVHGEREEAHVGGDEERHQEREPPPELLLRRLELLCPVEAGGRCSFVRHGRRRSGTTRCRRRAPSGSAPAGKLGGGGGRPLQLRQARTEEVGDDEVPAASSFRQCSSREIGRWRRAAAAASSGTDGGGRGRRGAGGELLYGRNRTGARGQHGRRSRETMDRRMCGGGRAAQGAAVGRRDAPERGGGMSTGAQG